MLHSPPSLHSTLVTGAAAIKAGVIRGERGGAELCSGQWCHPNSEDLGTGGMVSIDLFSKS